MFSHRCRWNWKTFPPAILKVFYFLINASSLIRVIVGACWDTCCCLRIFRMMPMEIVSSFTLPPRSHLRKSDFHLICEAQRWFPFSSNGCLRRQFTNTLVKLQRKICGFLRHEFLSRFLTCELRVLRVNWGLSWLIDVHQQICLLSSQHRHLVRRGKEVSFNAPLAPTQFIKFPVPFAWSPCLIALFTRRGVDFIADAS